MSAGETIEHYFTAKWLIVSVFFLLFFWKILKGGGGETESISTRLKTHQLKISIRS